MERVGPSSAVAARRMALDDVPRVAAIEAEAFTSPWKADTFATLLERPGAELWVLDALDVGVVAYAVIWCILDQGELANIAVASTHRGQGHGRRLLGLALDAARQRGVKSIYLEVRSTNVRAASLYRTFGFERIGVRRDYYDNPIEDAILMVARL